MGRLAVAAILSLWAIPFSILVNRIVPDPYMDEIFHIPQVQQYCMGNFRSWDPMITTPPGLYYLSLAQVASLFPGMFCVKAVSSFSEVCSPAILRFINVFLAVTCGILVYEIIILLRPGLDQRKATLYTVVLALYPVHWFFTFLYYTDVASLTAVLAMYVACLKRKYLFSALLGGFAILIRQTNIIWMLFVVCTAVINVTLVHHRNDATVENISIKNNSKLIPNKNVIMDSNLRQRKFVSAVDTVNHFAPKASTLSTTKVTTKASGFLDEILAILLTSWHLKWELLVSFIPFFVVLAAFVAFIHWNGSLVLGAKEAHTVSPHFAQILYFSLVSVLAMAPVHFTSLQAADLFQSLWKNRWQSFLLGVFSLSAGFLSVHFFSIAHPYLLADNRHYPFYLWRKVIRAHWSMKYILVPLYVYSWLSIFRVLGKVQRKTWVLVYFLACAAVLVPAPLIEFRYYTIPFYMLILHSHITDNRSLLLMGILYTAVNVFTMMMFLFRPFYWDHEPGIQRFIW